MTIAVIDWIFGRQSRVARVVQFTSARFPQSTRGDMIAGTKTVQKIDSMLRTGAIVCYDDEQRAIW
jgi:hypothetical protein